MQAIFCLCLFALPPQAPMPPQAPTPPASCRCGTGCPLGGGCERCSCAVPAVPPSPAPGLYEQGWRYDATRGYWWRYAPAAVAAPVAMPASAPAFRFAPAPVTFRAAPAYCPGGS